MIIKLVIKYWASAGKSINMEWFLLRRFLDLVRDIKILAGLDRFCPLLVICRDLVSCMARNQKLDLRNYVFFKFLISFDEDNIVKVRIDHAVCEEIAATDG